MKLKIEQPKLQALLKELNTVVPGNLARSPIYHHIKIETVGDGVLFYATDGELFLERHIPCEWEAPGACTAPAKSFLELVKTIDKTKEITLTLLDEKRLRVSHGRCRSHLSSVNPHEFPTLKRPEKDAFDMLNAEAFAEALEKVAYSMSNDETRMNLVGIYLDKANEEGFGRAVATDGHRLATYKFAGVITPFMIPKVAYPPLKLLLTGEEEVGIHVDDTFACVLLKSGMFKFRLVSKPFPEYQRILPTGKYQKVVLKKEELVGPLKRAILFSVKQNKVDFDIKPGKVKISSRGDLGDDEEELEVGPGSDIGGGAQLSFNGDYILQAISKFTGEEFTMRIYGELSPVLFQGSINGISIVMPIRG